MRIERGEEIYEAVGKRFDLAARRKHERLRTSLGHHPEETARFRQPIDKQRVSALQLFLHPGSIQSPRWLDLVVARVRIPRLCLQPFESSQETSLLGLQSSKHGRFGLLLVQLLSPLFEPFEFLPDAAFFGGDRS